MDVICEKFETKRFKAERPAYRNFAYCCIKEENRLSFKKGLPLILHHLMTDRHRNSNYYVEDSPTQQCPCSGFDGCQHFHRSNVPYCLGPYCFGIHQHPPPTPVPTLRMPPTFLKWLRRQMIFNQEYSPIPTAIVG